MTEFADAGNKEKTLLCIAFFENAEKALQLLLDHGDVRIGNVIQYRLVVLINKNDDWTFRIKFVDQFPQTQSGSPIAQPDGIGLSDFFDFCHQVSG